MCDRVKVDLKEYLKETYYHLRVDINMGSLIRAVHKLFNLDSNYPKADGDSFRLNMEEHYPNTLLRHVESTNRNRQDMLTACAGPVCFNARFYMECLDKILVTLGKNYVLEDNTSTLLGTTNVLGLLRAHATHNEAITIPMRWLTANYHKLATHGSSV